MWLTTVTGKRWPLAIAMAVAIGMPSSLMLNVSVAHADSPSCYAVQHAVGYQGGGSLGSVAYSTTQYCNINQSFIRVQVELTTSSYTSIRLGAPDDCYTCSSQYAGDAVDSSQLNYGQLYDVWGYITDTAPPGVTWGTWPSQCSTTDRITLYCTYVTSFYYDGRTSGNYF